jgi:competence protein ComEA
VSRGALVLAMVVWGLALARPAPAPAACAAGPLCGEPLDLNAAPAVWLETLPGIGPARAGAIAAARPFAHVDELERVPGIGRASVRRLRGRVEVR